MTWRLSDVIQKMEAIAPSHLSASWDNTGLQIGQPDWQIKTIWLALDPLPSVIQAACESGTDLLITHHPLIFRPLTRLDFSTPIGASIQAAIQHRLAVYAAHTNLDSAAGGVNDVLCDCFNLKNIEILAPYEESERCKLVVFVPAGSDDEKAVLQALFETAAGRIGAYSCCSFRSSGTGTFKPEETADPYIGEKNSLSEVDEIRLETVVSKKDLADVIAHVRARHPYETMAYDVYPILTAGSGDGSGRVGELPRQTSLGKLASRIKKDLQLNAIRIAGRSDLSVKRVAVCSGSGSSFLNDFISSSADVFISGDLHYHDARAVEEADRGLIDVGHFASEHLMLDTLAARLQSQFEKTDGLNIMVCDLEKDPFVVL